MNIFQLLTSLFFMASQSFAWISDEDYQTGEQDCFSNTICRKQLPNSYCTESGSCECLDGYVKYTTQVGECSPNSISTVTCLEKSRGLDSYCIVDAQCIEALCPRSYCDSTLSVCKCQPDSVYIYDLKTCVPLRHSIGDACSESKRQCDPIPHSMCRKGRCLCNQRTFLNLETNSCELSSLRIGMPCDDDNKNASSYYHCSHQKNVYCYKGKCSCISGYVPNKDMSICLETVPFLHEPCEVNDQCQVKNSMCTRDGTKQICQCIPGFIDSDGDCIEIRHHEGSPCTRNHQCQNGQLGLEASCFNGRCLCNDGWVAAAMDGACHKIANEEGESCEVDEQCSAGNNTTRKCEFNNVLGGTTCSTDKKHFLEKRYGDECHSNDDCKRSIKGESLCNMSKVPITKTSIKEKGTCGCSHGFMINFDGTACLQR